MKSNGHWNSKNPKDLAVFGLVPALAIFGPCQPLEVWIRRLFIERHLLLPYVFDKMASRFQIFQSETLLGTGRETFFLLLLSRISCSRLGVELGGPSPVVSFACLRQLATYRFDVQ